MTICITGSNGFIGQHLLKALSSYNSPLLSPSRIELDLNQPDSVSAYFKKHKPTHLIHLAWYTKHRKFWNAPENFDCVINSLHLLRSFHKNGGHRIVCAGTCAEYDWSADEIFDEYSSPLKPQSVYGQCKDVTRRLVQSYCEYNNLSWAWGRVFFPYGPGEPSGKLIPSLIRSLTHKADPFGINKTARRDFIYIDDVAAAFKILASSKDNGIFNIASGASRSLEDIVRYIASSTEQDPNRILDLQPSTLDPVPCLAASNSRLKDLGWFPKFTLDDGLSKLLSLALES